MVAGKVSARTAILWMVVTMACGVYAKEYILEDLIAMETGRRNNHLAAIAGDARKGSIRIQKTPRGVEQKKNTTSENGGGDKDEDDEDKKTLAQQVADGKYGLIQKELFVDPPRRPGIISYEVNPEVPKDNVNNLGGLKPEEIWLAENHLLVLAGGGGFDDTPSVGQVWPPIDNYKAPPRQVKIPPEPKVPPPFPIQLRPGGPTEFIRGVNGTGGPPPFPFFPPPPPGNFTGGGGPPPFFGPPINSFRGNFTPGNGPIPPPFPFPPFPINGSIGPPPFGAFPPPGANFLPPPVNLTGPLDEDDPSIYYPPPYDFVYKSRANTSAVPPGPLVPGIVLPPPPDFFAPLEDEKPKPHKPAKRPQVAHKPKRPRPSVSVLTTVTTTTTTKRPAVKIVTDDPSQHVDLNEVTPTAVAHALPPDAVVRGWVPIPAPRPFYISGIAKPQFKSVRARPQFHQPDDYVDGYHYAKPVDIYGTPNDEPQKWLNAYNASRPVYVDRPVYYRPTTTAAPPAPYPNKGKAIKNFYFYDEPVSTPVAPPRSYYTSQAPAYYREPVSPLQYFYITESPPPSAHSTTTVRPPVFEYSYTAPGYGTVEAPRLSVLTTTAAPPSYHAAPAYDYPSQAPYAGVTTPSPPVHRPAHQSTTAKSPYIVQTDNPYHAYFTHHDYSLIDDITKKYFTVFGQKLNNGDGPTTPLTGSVEDVTSRPTPRPAGARVKYPAQAQVPVQPTYSTAFWSTTTRAPPSQDVRYQQYPEYDYFYGSRGSDYEYGGVRDYYDDGQTRHSAALTAGGGRVNDLRPTKQPDVQRFVRPNADLAYLVGPSKTQAAQSLRFDTRVNYLRPPAVKNPDAEQFDPAYGPPPHGQNSFDPQTRQKVLLDLYERLLGRQETDQRYRPYSLADDIRVNDRLVGLNATVPPDVEVFDPDVFQPGRGAPHEPSPTAGGTAPNAALIAYSLPGNGGGHFYFLTPQSVAPDRRRNVHRQQDARRHANKTNQRTIQR